MKRVKKGAMEISVGAIVILILAITFLSLGLVFTKGLVSKMFMRFDEQISEEPEPPKPTMTKPITLSRNPIQAQENTAEVIKISVMNPTQTDWNNRQFIKTDNLCGKADDICFIDKDDTTSTCDASSYEDKDPDCSTGFFTSMDCLENGEKSPCLISNLAGDLYCPLINELSREPDCLPRKGVDIVVKCDDRIMEQPYKRTIDPIKKGDYITNIIILKLKKNIMEDQYLCQVRVFGENKEYLEDLVVRIDNG
jgi:hypothetical protein